MSDSNSEQQDNIKFVIKLKKSVTETFQWLTEAYGKDCIICPHIDWHKWSGGGRESMTDDDFPGHPHVPFTANNV
jgi:hypothetical protein